MALAAGDCAKDFVLLIYDQQPNEVVWLEEFLNEPLLFVGGYWLHHKFFLAEISLFFYLY